MKFDQKVIAKLTRIKVDEEQQKRQELMESIEVPVYVGDGRPPVIANPTVYRGIVVAVLEGNYITTAAHMVGVTHGAVLNALDKGEKAEDEFYYQFWMDVKRAEAMAQADMVKIIHTHAEYDWKAALAWLERRDPEHWGRRDTVRHEGTINHEHRNVLADRILNDETMLENARALLRGNTYEGEYEIENE